MKKSLQNLSFEDLAAILILIFGTATVFMLFSEIVKYFSG